MVYFFHTLLSWLFSSAPDTTNTSSSAFEVFKDRAGEYRFRLLASNGETILASEGYKTKASAKKGIASVRRNAPDESNYERKTAKDGQAMFNLRAANHEVIGTSELYTSTYNRDRGIQSVKRHAPNADLIDLT